MSTDVIFLSHNCNVAFIENELRAMLGSEHIGQVTIYTDHPLRDHEIAGHARCKVHLYDTTACKPSWGKSVRLFLSEWWNNRRIYRRPAKLRYMLSLMRNELAKAAFIEANGIPEGAVLYSYWGGNEAFILADLKARGHRNLALTRMHAFDIYEEFDNNGHIPWRWFILRHLDRFITISKHGETYFTGKYPQALGRTKTFYLGIYGAGEGPLNPAPESGYSVVSCGWVNRHKNHAGILHALKGLNGVKWQHIGNGDDFEILKREVNEHATFPVSLRGGLTQEEIRKVYAGEPLTCFMSLSTTEGIPVSMMEALAFGIPVVSTDVGGCGELVGKQNGVLLPENYTHEDVKEAVQHCALNFSGTEARNAIRRDCLERYDAGQNYRRFFEYLDTENKTHHSA